VLGPLLQHERQRRLKIRQPTLFTNRLARNPSSVTQHTDDRNMLRRRRTAPPCISK
jgi:hypothetical protein